MIELSHAPFARLPEPVLALALAFALDALVGEPPARLHPVVGMGRLIGALERRAPPAGARAQLTYGVFMALLIPGLFAAGAWSLSALLAPRPGPASTGRDWARWVLEIFLLKSTFAVRALGRAAGAVRTALEASDLTRARVALRSLCSRDASELTPPQLAAATVESVAENLSDSFVAPIFWFAVAGLPGAMAYRAVNTLDASIGYHGRYEWLGKASARLDDLLNWIPARLTAALLILAGPLAGGRARRGLRALRRDGAKTESPNAGHPMAAMAGLLGVELEKVGHYRLGDPEHRVTAATIAQAWGCCRAATALTLAAFAFGWMALHA